MNKLPLVFQRIAGAMQGVVEIGETQYSPQKDDGGCWLVQLRKGQWGVAWGRGRTLDDAVAQCRKNGGRMPPAKFGKIPTKEASAHWCPRIDGLRIDDDGAMLSPVGVPVFQMWPPSQEAAR